MDINPHVGAKKSHIPLDLSCWSLPGLCSELLGRQGVGQLLGHPLVPEGVLDQLRVLSVHLIHNQVGNLWSTRSELQQDLISIRVYIPGGFCRQASSYQSRHHPLQRDWSTPLQPWAIPYKRRTGGRWRLESRNPPHDHHNPCWGQETVFPSEWWGSKCGQPEWQPGQ